jgi:hypothetical protein
MLAANCLGSRMKKYAEGFSGIRETFNTLWHGTNKGESPVASMKNISNRFGVRFKTKWCTRTCDYNFGYSEHINTNLATNRPSLRIM